MKSKYRVLSVYGVGCLTGLGLLQVPSVLHADSYALSTLVTFDSTNGSLPIAPLTVGPDGNLYGTTGTCGPGGAGTVFEVDRNTGALTTLAAFNRTSGPAAPDGGVTFDSSGNIYGTTIGGGNAQGDGTVYQISAATGALSTLVTFNGTTAANPESTLAIDSSGNLYGTTPYNFSRLGNNETTVFSVSTTTGAYNVLVPSTGGLQSSFQGLTLDASGNLYGTSPGGGGGGGYLFEINGATNAVTTLYTFTSPGTTGWLPESTLTLGPDGNLYGATVAGGANGDGEVYEFNLATGVFSVLASFNGTNGKEPNTNITFDAAGNMYGTTSYGGASNMGTVFEIDAVTHAITSLVSFDGANGAHPQSSLVLFGNTFYGVTPQGGASGNGTVFALSPTISSTSGVAPGSMLVQAPEPSTALLAALGLVALPLLRRRRARRRAGGSLCR